MQSGQLGNILNSDKVSTRLKLKALRAFVFPVVAWGSETWTPSQGEDRALNTFWNKKLRQCLGITKFDHVETDAILEITGELPLSTRIRKLRLRYFGHVVRYPESRWVRMLLRATPSTTTTTRPKKGRPKDTWIARSSTELLARSAKVEDCLERERWRNIIEDREQGTRIDLTLNTSDLARTHKIRDIRKAQGRIRFREVVGENPS